MNYGSFVESLVVKEEQEEREGGEGGSEWNTNREVTRLVLVNNMAGECFCIFNRIRR